MRYYVQIWRLDVTISWSLDKKLNTSILELLNSSFDNHNKVKFGENFADNLSRHFVFTVYRNKIIENLLNLDPDLLYFAVGSLKLKFLGEGFRHSDTLL